MLGLPATLELLSPLLAPNGILLPQPGASVSNVFCALLRLLSRAHFHTVPPEKQDASHGVRVSAFAAGRPSSLFHGLIGSGKEVHWRLVSFITLRFLVR